MSILGAKSSSSVPKNTAVLSLYAGLGIAAIFISAGRDDPDIFRIAGVSTLEKLVVGPFLGLAIGLFFVAITRWLVLRFSWAKEITSQFRDILGELSIKDIFVLAIASATGEELLFRGALLPWIGLWPQAILFALLHIGPSKKFLPWTASALFAGVVFGLLFTATGNLGAPIAAHFIVNFLNLRFIAQYTKGTQ